MMVNVIWLARLMLDAFWAEGPLMGHILSTGITARPGLRITQDSAGPQDKGVGTRYWEKRLPSYILSFQAKHSQTTNDERESSTRLLSLFRSCLFV